MANVLTDLAADIYKAADVISREMVGVIPSVTINGDDSQRVAVGDTVRSHFTREATAKDNSPSMAIPEGDDQTVDNKTLTISKNRGVQIPWTGEDVRHVNNGPGFETLYGDQILQAMRTLTNEIEVDLATEIANSASRVHGTAGTTPFGSDLSDTAQVHKILADNGCPMNDGQLSMVIDTTAGANLRSLTQLSDADRSGSTAMLRQGALLDVHGFMLKESAGIRTFDASGEAGDATVDAAGAAIGDTSIPVVADADGIAITAGNFVTIGNHDYVVASDLTLAGSASGTLIIEEPGLREAVEETDAVTVNVTNFVRNIALHRSAAELVMRPPSMPQGGDSADDAMTVMDPRSGLTFEIRTYRGFQKAMMNVSAAWGYKHWKPAHSVVLAG